MPADYLSLSTDAPIIVSDDTGRSLAQLPCYDLEQGVTFVPRDTCQLRHCTLCLTIGRGIREDCYIDIKIGPDYQEHVDVSYVSGAQRIRVPLSPAATVLLNRYDLEIQSSVPLWIVAEQERFPYLGICLSSSQEENDYLSRLCDSGITAFGWMYGCVGDGLLALHKASGEARYIDALKNQLDCFLTEDAVDYENPRNEVAINDFHSIELTLPFAQIVQLYPDHPSVDAAVNFLRSKRIDSGLIYDGYSITTEGCYTIAYPLMQIGMQRADQELIDWSWQQLALRREALFQDGHIYLRNYEGNKSFEDWSRGVAWYALGHVRTQIANGAEPTPEMLAHFKELAALFVEHQNAQGLWYNFWSQTDLPIDSSGSAGIACALALMVKHGWIDESYLDKARKCLDALQAHLVDGGFLNSVAPNNKRGEEHQRRALRTCEPLGLGLLGQLHAALL